MEKQKKELRPYESLRNQIIERMSQGSICKITARELAELAGVWKNGRGILRLLDVVNILNARKIDYNALLSLYRKTTGKKRDRLIEAVLGSGRLAYIEYTGRR